MTIHVWLVSGILLPALAFALLVRRTLGPGAATGALAAGLGLGIGTGLAAAGFSMSRFVLPSEWLPLSVWIDCVFWVMTSVIALAVPIRPTVVRQFMRESSPPSRFVAAALACVVGISVVYFAVQFLRLPHGQWDAWAIWNLKARFLARGGEHWQDLFSNAITHPEYPHLIPAAVARLWLWIGGEAPLAGSIVGASFTYAVPLVVIGSLACLRGWTEALWGGLLVLAATPLTIYGAFQVADVPFAFFMLASVVLIAFDITSEQRWRFSTVAGMAVGLASLVKNEGYPFTIGMTLAYVGYQFAWDRRPFASRMVRVTGFVVAALPFWVLLLMMKSAAPDVGIGAAFTSEAALGKLTDPGRHKQIITAFVKTTWGWAGVWFAGVVPVFTAALLVAGWRLDRRLRAAVAFAVAAMAIMLGSYYVAYLVSPYQLSWHIASSLHRILVHLWPTFVWAFCLVVSFEAEQGVPKTLSPRRPSGANAK